MIVFVLKLIILVALVVFAAMVIYSRFLVGIDHPRFMLDTRSALRVESSTDKEIVLACDFAMTNDGPDMSGIHDVFARGYLPQEQYDLAVCTANVEAADDRRKDNYLQGFCLDPGEIKKLILTLTFVATEGHSIEEAMSQMVDMDVVVYFTGAGRKEYYVERKFVTFLSSEFKDALGGEHK